MKPVRFDIEHASRKIKSKLTQVMNILAEYCRTTAIESMATPKSGEHMGRYTRASAPYEPPAIQTGNLSTHIAIKKEGMDRYVGTNVKATFATKPQLKALKSRFAKKLFARMSGGYAYPYWLEFGSAGGRILPRPFMRPALARTHAYIPQAIALVKGKQ